MCAIVIDKTLYINKCREQLLTLNNEGQIKFEIVYSINKFRTRQGCTLKKIKANAVRLGHQKQDVIKYRNDKTFGNI